MHFFFFRIMPLLLFCILLFSKSINCTVAKVIYIASIWAVTVFNLFQNQHRLHGPISKMAVFGENLGVSIVGIVGVGGIKQKLWHFVISVITEDIYLKLKVCVHYPRAVHTIKGDSLKCIFFQNYAPFSTFYPLSSTPLQSDSTCSYFRCFQKQFFLRMMKTWDCVIKHLTLSSINIHFNTLKKKALGKHCGKSWNCSRWASSPF